MSDLDKLIEKMDCLENKLKVLSDGYIPINHKKFQLVMENILKGIFQEEEKVKIMREVKQLGVMFGVLGLSLLTFIIYLLTFTTPI